MGEDEIHSGDGSVDLFTEEELLPLSVPSFRSVTKSWPASAKPKLPTQDSTITQSVPKPKLEESVSSPSVKSETLNNSGPALTKTFHWSTTHTTPQTLPGIQEEREEKTTSQMNVMNMESTSSIIKMSNSESSEMTGTTIPSTVAGVISQSEVTTKTLTEQTHNTGTISREDFSQVNKQNTPSTVTPSPITQSQTIIIPDSYSTTTTDDGSLMETSVGMTATTTDSNTGATTILTTSNVTESEGDSSTTTSMAIKLVNSTTTTISSGKADKPNTHSIRLAKKQQDLKRKIIKTVENEDIEKKPQKQPGK